MKLSPKLLDYRTLTLLVQLTEPKFPGEMLVAELHPNSLV